MDRAQLDGEVPAFYLGLIGSAAIAGVVAVLVDPPIVDREPVVSWPTAFGIVFFTVLIATLVLSLASRILSRARADRGQVAGPTPVVGPMLVVVVAVVTYSEILEYQNQKTPSGANLGAPPQFSIEAVLVLVALLAVLGGVVFLSRRVGE